MTVLANKRIVITRPRAHANELSAKLEALGAQVILFPVIEIILLEDYSKLDTAIRALSSYDWVIFTSANGVEAFWKRCEYIGVREVSSLISKVAAIGPATAAALRSRGIQPALMPHRYVAEDIASDMGELASQRILLLRAERARDALPNDLRARGAIVDDVPSYRTMPVTPEPDVFAEFQRGVDMIAFASSSAATSFADLMHRSNLQNPNWLIACLGPVTADTARQAGFKVTVTAATYTTDGLVSAIVDYYISHL